MDLSVLEQCVQKSTCVTEDMMYTATVNQDRFAQLLHCYLNKYKNHTTDTYQKTQTTVTGLDGNIHDLFLDEGSHLPWNNKSLDLRKLSLVAHDALQMGI